MVPRWDSSLWTGRLEMSGLAELHVDIGVLSFRAEIRRRFSSAAFPRALRSVDASRNETMTMRRERHGASTLASRPALSRLGPCIPTPGCNYMTSDAHDSHVLRGGQCPRSTPRTSHPF